MNYPIKKAIYRRGIFPGLVFICLLESCYTYKIAPTGAQSSTFTVKKTYWSFFWGLKQPTIIPANCNNLGMSNVVFKTNYAGTLLTVATLGIVNPISVAWQCDKCMNVQ